MTMEKKEKFGIATECGVFGEMNLKNDPSFKELEEEDVKEAIEEAIKRNRGIKEKK